MRPRRSVGVEIFARQECARGAMRPVEVRTAKLEVVQERPAQCAANNTDGRRNDEISSWTRNVHGSVVISRFSQISHETRHLHFPQAVLSVSRCRALRGGYVDLRQPSIDSVSKIGPCCA